MAGRISIDNLSESLKEYLNGLGLSEEQVRELVNNMILDVIGELSNLNTTNKDSIVSSINELFQSGNNVKQELVAALIAKGLEATISESFDELIQKINEVKTGEGDAIASDALEGKTFVNDSGELITGNIPIQKTEAYTVTPGNSNIVLPAGYYGGNITIAGDADLIASNILSGKTIFGISGTGWDGV